MYYQNYEDYMRSVLGYSINPSEIYENHPYSEQQTVNKMMDYYPTYQYSGGYEELSRFSEDDVHSFYPKIYHLISPVIGKVCDANKDPISNELIEKMTEEVYEVVEEQTETMMNARTEKGNNTEIEKSEVRNMRREDSMKNALKEGREVKKEERQTRKVRCRNQLLRDLIKILILDRIFSNHRPPRPLPPRPPFSGGPGRPPIGPGRPPVRPRDYSEYLN